MSRMRIAQAAAVLALTVAAPLFAGTTATSAPAQPALTLAVQGNMGWQ